MFIFFGALSALLNVLITTGLPFLISIPTLYSACFAQLFASAYGFLMYKRYVFKIKYVSNTNITVFFAWYASLIFLHPLFCQTLSSRLPPLASATFSVAFLSFCSYWLLNRFIFAKS